MNDTTTLTKMLAGAIASYAICPAVDVSASVALRNDGTAYTTTSIAAVTRNTLPARIIDYVIVHELAHVHEPRHTAEYWDRLQRAMPDYQQRKTWLATSGAGF